MNVVSIASLAARFRAGSHSGKAPRGRAVANTVICFVLPWCIQPFASQIQHLEPKAALSSIISLPTADRASAVAIVRQCNAHDAWALSALLMQAAARMLDAGDLSRSTFYYESAVESARIAEAQGLLADADYRLGSNYLQSHDYLRAEESLLDGVRASERGKVEISLINNLGALGALYIRLAKYDAADRASRQALGRITSSPNRSSISYQYGEATVCSNLGTISEWNGDHTAALEFFHRAVGLFGELDRKIGGYQSSVLDNLILIGESYYYIGDHRAALDSYSKALAGAKEHGFKKLLLSVLNDLGILYMDQGDFVRATDLFTKSLHATDADGDPEITTLATCNLGVSNERQGRYDRAAVIFSDCLRLAQQSSRPGLGILALEGLASAFRGEGKHEEALEYLDRALRIATELSDKLRQSELLWRKAVIFHERREYERSLEFSNKALLLADEIHETNYSYLALTLMGKDNLALGRNEPANSVLQRAIDAVEQIRRQVGGQEQQRAYFLERKIEPYQLMVDLLMRRSRPEEALDFAERARSRALLDLVGNAKFDISQVMAPNERAEERRLDGQISALNTKLYRQYRQNAPDTLRISAVRDSLEKARIEYDSFLDRIFASHPQLKVDRAQVAPFSTQEAKLALVSEDAAAIEFQVLDDKVLVLAVDFINHAPRIAAHSIQVSKNELSERIEDFRVGIIEKRIGLEKLASGLYQLLLAPVAAIIDGKKTIVVIPDDMLWELPFQALKDPSGRYLIQGHSLFYAPSLTALREILKRESISPAQAESRPSISATDGMEPPLLAFGNPEISVGTINRLKETVRDEKLGPIPETKLEVETLGRLYGAARSELFVGKQATEKNAKAEMPRFKVLHFATHGILDSQDPLYSHILLSGSGSNEDGLLEAREIMNLNLNADIAILSACDTARGRISSGEGVIGMAWAFFVAGCPTTVVSQWSVNSESTTRLMIEFHRALLARNRGLNRMRNAAEALRDAQLIMLKTQSYRHPLYWAGFVVVGDGW